MPHRDDEGDHRSQPRPVCGDRGEEDGHDGSGGEDGLGRAGVGAMGGETGGEGHVEAPDRAGSRVRIFTVFTGISPIVLVTCARLMPGPA
jgi:hypothetical protein